MDTHNKLLPIIIFIKYFKRKWSSIMAKKVKSISFNDSNKEECEMLKFIGRRNFSKYVKDLIRNDMLLNQAVVSEVEEKVMKNYSLYMENENKPKLSEQRLINQGGLRIKL